MIGDHLAKAPGKRDRVVLAMKKVTQAQMLAEFRNWTPFAGLQIEYSLLERTVEGELVPMARELGTGPRRIDVPRGPRSHPAPGLDPPKLYGSGRVARGVSGAAQVVAAEEERFELPDSLHRRRFSNSGGLPAGSCTERISAENESSGTMPEGLNGTERHRDHDLDQGPDHETKNPLGLVQSARDLLVAVADGEPRSLELAAGLVSAVLSDPSVARALALDELLRTRSPFALVRAVELAELVVVGATGAAARSKYGHRP